MDDNYRPENDDLHTSVTVGNRRVFINPGAGPVTDANIDHALRNIEHFIKDIGIAGVEWEHNEALTADGRYGLTLTAPNGSMCQIEMPGRELSGVRFTGEANQNIWHFPRLYVDGNSWVWQYAVSQARETLTGRQDE